MGRIDDDLFDEDAGEFVAGKEEGKLLTATLEKHKWLTELDLYRITGLSMTAILDWLETCRIDKLTGEQEIGSRTAYYLLKNEPQGKLYFGRADGRTICLREEAPRGNTGDRRVGQKLVLDLPKPAPDERKLYLRNLPTIDPEEVERLAEINPDIAAVADELEVDANRLRYELNHQQNLKRAYEKGRKIYMENTKENGEKKTIGDAKEKAAHGAANGSGKPLTVRARLTEAVVEQAGLDGLSMGNLAKRIGATNKTAATYISAIIHDPKYPELYAALERGRKRRADAKSTAAVHVKQEKPEPKKPIELPEPPSEIESPVEKEAAENFETANEKPEPKRPENFLDHRENFKNDVPPANWKIVAAEKSPEADVQENEIETETDPRFAHTLERIGTSGHSREKIEAVKNKLIPPRKPFPVGDAEFLGRIGTIQPEGLNVGFNGDFFALNSSQREILCLIADLNDKFQEEEKSND